MKITSVLSLALALSVAPALAAKKADPKPAPQAQQCFPMMPVLENIDSKLPIVTVINLPAEKRALLLAWFNALPPADTTQYDLVLVLDHGEGRYAVVVGWVKDKTLKGPSLCAGAFVAKDRMAKFLEITGLPGDNGTI